MEHEHEVAVAALQRRGRPNPLTEEAWSYNEAGGAAPGQRGPFSLLTLLAMLRGALSSHRKAEQKLGVNGEPIAGTPRNCLPKLLAMLRGVYV